MSVSTYQLDANVLLRFLQNDHKDHSPRAKKLIEDANAGKLILEVSAVTVAESSTPSRPPIALIAAPPPIPSRPS